MMLVFTLISRAVSGAAMARVKTVKLSTGTIDHKVSGSGKVEAGKEVAVYTESGQRVKEICVQEGQSVEQGEVLFLLDEKCLEEQILAAQQELEKLRLQDQDAKSSQEAQQEARALAKKRAAEDYNQAVSKGDADVAKAKADWDAAERALQEFLQNTPRPAETVGAACLGGAFDCAARRAGGAPASQPGFLSGALNHMDGNVKGKEDAGVRTGAKNLGMQNMEAEASQGTENPGAPSIGSSKGAQNREEEIYGNGMENNGNPSLGIQDKQSGNPFSKVQAANQERNQPLEEQANQEGNQPSKGQANPDGSQLSEGQVNPDESQPSEGQANQDGSQPSEGQDNQSQEGSLAEWESQKAQLEQSVTEAKAAYEAAVSARTDGIRTAVRAVEDAAAPSPTDSTAAQNEIAKKQQELAVHKLQSLQKDGGKVAAPVAGMVTQIAVTTGDFTTEGTAVRLADTSKGNRLVASVSKSDEAYVQKGGQVTISPSGSKEKLQDFSISNVSANKEDDALLDVSIDLPKGVLEPGASAQIEIVQKSVQYSSVIPIQALYEEQAGYYVLVLREVQGVMGQELVAERMDVQVLDKNSASAALEEGLLTGEQEIISTSSRSIGDGSRVRREE